MKCTIELVGVIYMILIEGNWEEVNDLNTAINIVGGYYNPDLADEIARLSPIHSDEEYFQLLDQLDNLEKENERLHDENNALDLQNDKLREEIKKLEDALHETE